jgi:FHA domain
MTQTINKPVTDRGFASGESMPEKNSNDNFETMTFVLPTQDISKFSGQPIDDSLIPLDGITFYILRLAKMIVVREQGNFFIGRNVQEDLWIPQVNLAEPDGFARSVSRRHAMIRPVDQGYEITDLFSRNGTRLDDQRLLPNKAYPLPSGTHLSVGQEQLMVMYRNVQISR